VLQPDIDDDALDAVFEDLDDLRKQHKIREERKLIFDALRVRPSPFLPLPVEQQSREVFIKAKLEQCDEPKPQHDLEAYQNLTKIQQTRVIDMVSFSLKHSTRTDFVVSNPALNAYTSNVEAKVDMPTIEAHSVWWSLNELQHAAFALVAKRILFHICLQADVLKLNALPKDVSSLSTISCKDTLRAALIGMGGTGKTAVIDSIVDFARRWNSSNLIVVVATSGNAASLIKGRTWQSALQIIPNANFDSKPSQDLIDEWRNVALLIIDEVSMLGRSELGKISIKLQKLRSGDTRHFGGVNVLFAG
jgi:hypothetical protein